MYQITVKKLSERSDTKKKDDIPFQPKEPKTMGMYLNKRKWYELN